MLHSGAILPFQGPICQAGGDQGRFAVLMPHPTAHAFAAHAMIEQLGGLSVAHAVGHDAGHARRLPDRPEARPGLCVAHGPPVRAQPQIPWRMGHGRQLVRQHLQRRATQIDRPIPSPYAITHPYPPGGQISILYRQRPGVPDPQPGVAQPRRARLIPVGRRIRRHRPSLGHTRFDGHPSAGTMWRGTGSGWASGGRAGRLGRSPRPAR